MEHSGQPTESGLRTISTGQCVPWVLEERRNWTVYLLKDLVAPELQGRHRRPTGTGRAQGLQRCQRQGSHPAGAANGVTQSQEDGSHTLRTQGASVSSMLGKCLLTVWGKRALIQRVPVSMASYVTVPRSGHRCDLAKCRVGSGVHTGH